MKTLKIFSIASILILISAILFAQGNAIKKETFKVWGNCGMCKKNIEGAAKTAGAKFASWNTETKMMTVKFSDDKSSVKSIQSAIAAKGYDTEMFKGDDKAYEELEPCCQYDRKSEAAALKAACGMACCEKCGCCKADDKCCADKSCNKPGGCCTKESCKDECKKKEASVNSCGPKASCCKKEMNKKS